MNFVEMNTLAVQAKDTYTLTIDGEAFRKFFFETIEKLLSVLTGSEAQSTWVKQDLKKVNYATFIADANKFRNQSVPKIEVWLECSECGMNAIEHQCEDCNDRLCHQCFIKTKCAALEEEVRQDTIFEEAAL